jgi:hypothetical protein
VRVAILDDYFDTLRTLRCFQKLSAHEVTVFNDDIQDVEGLGERLRGFDALVLGRERLGSDPTRRTEAASAVGAPASYQAPRAPTATGKSRPGADVSGGSATRTARSPS